MLALLALAEVLGMSLWFSASAVSAQFRTLWDLTRPETAWLTTAVQLGFVVGTGLAAVLNLADLVPSRVLRGVGPPGRRGECRIGRRNGTRLRPAVPLPDWSLPRRCVSSSHEDGRDLVPH
jgi:hypothetical protein